MNTLFKALALLASIGLLPAGAVSLSEDGTGQVLLFPQFIAGAGWRSTIKIRNTGSERARAVRVVFKDPVNGRPTGALNVYLLPGDSWEATLKDTDESVVRSLRVADGRLAPWDDSSCTFPDLGDLPAAGLLLSDSQLDEDFGDVEVPKRTNYGSIEVYEMGALLPEHAANCAAVRRRFVDEGGAWFDADPAALRNRAIGPPRGGLEGQLTLINFEFGISYQMDALAFQDFTDQALHTHPDNARTPSLMDVSPAVSRVFVDRELPAGTQRIERLSSWDFPAHAIDALLMSTRGRADYHSEGADVLSFLILNLPTAPYHNDADGFYLAESGRVAAPFPESAELGFAQTVDGPAVKASASNLDAERFDLMVSGGNMRCDQFRGMLTSVELSNLITFTRECDLTEAELRIPGVANKGTIEFEFDGQLVSREGHVYSGLPIYGHLFQIFRRYGPFRNSHGWSQPLKREPGFQSP